MKKKRHFRIAIVTAMLTFGALAFAKGAIYNHHSEHHNKHFDKTQKEDNCNFHFWQSKKDSNEKIIK